MLSPHSKPPLPPNRPREARWTESTSCQCALVKAPPREAASAQRRCARQEAGKGPHRLPQKGPHRRRAQHHNHEHSPRKRTEHPHRTSVGTPSARLWATHARRSNAPQSRCRLTGAAHRAKQPGHSVSRERQKCRLPVCLNCEHDHAGSRRCQQHHLKRTAIFDCSDYLMERLANRGAPRPLLGIPHAPSKHDTRRADKPGAQPQERPR